jgi:epsin
MCLTCASDTDYRHDKKCDAYTADDDDDHSSNKTTATLTNCKWWPPPTVVDEAPVADDASCWDHHTGEGLLAVDQVSSSTTTSSRLLASLGSRASGFQSLSQPEQRRPTTKKLQLQSQDY